MGIFIVSGQNHTWYQKTLLISKTEVHAYNHCAAWSDCRAHLTQTNQAQNGDNLVHLIIGKILEIFLRNFSCSRSKLSLFRCGRKSKQFSSLPWFMYLVWSLVFSSDCWGYFIFLTFYHQKKADQWTINVWLFIWLIQMVMGGKAWHVLLWLLFHNP